MICHCASQLPLHARGPLTLPELLPCVGPALPAHSARGFSSHPPAPALGSGQPRHCPQMRRGSSASCYTKKPIFNLKPPAPGKMDALWHSVRSSSLPSPRDSCTACTAAQDGPWWGLQQAFVQGTCVEHGLGWQRSQLLDNPHAPRDLRSPLSSVPSREPPPALWEHHWRSSHLAPSPIMQLRAQCCREKQTFYVFSQRCTR